MKKILSLSLLIFLLQGVFATPWDFLRIPAGIAAALNPIVVWIFPAITLIILIISLLAWKKKHSQKLLFVSMAFGLFFIKALLMLVDFYYSPGYFMNFAVQGLFDLFIIGSLFVALFRK